MAARALTVNDLLHQLSREGQTESTGSFKLDPRQAHQKLAEFQFPDKHFYVLKFLQSAVAGGATWVRVDANARQVKMSHDGRAIPSQAVPELMGYILDERANPEQRYLKSAAAGVHGSLAVAARQVSIKSWDGQSGFHHSWEAGGWSQETWNGKSGQRETQFILQRPLTEVLRGWGRLANFPIFDFLFRKANSYEGELLTIYNRGIYVPAPLALNGKILEASFGTAKGNSRHLIEAHYPAEEGRPASLEMPPESQAAKFLYQKPATGTRCRCWLALETRKSPIARITYVDDGVTICQKEYDFACPGVVGVYSAEELKKDLTGFQLVSDHNHDQHLTWLREQVRELQRGL